MDISRKKRRHISSEGKMGGGHGRSIEEIRERGEIPGWDKGFY